MTLTEAKRDRMGRPNDDLLLVGMTFGDVDELGGFGTIPSGMRRAGRQRRTPIRTGHRLPPPEAVLRTFR